MSIDNKFVPIMDTVWFLAEASYCYGTICIIKQYQGKECVFPLADNGKHYKEWSGCFCLIEDNSFEKNSSAFAHY